MDQKSLPCLTCKATVPLEEAGTFWWRPGERRWVGYCKPCNTRWKKTKRKEYDDAHEARRINGYSFLDVDEWARLREQGRIKHWEPTWEELVNED
jgi:hypothetical protein